MIVVTRAYALRHAIVRILLACAVLTQTFAPYAVSAHSIPPAVPEQPKRTTYNSENNPPPVAIERAPLVELRLDAPRNALTPAGTFALDIHIANEGDLPLADASFAVYADAGVQLAPDEHITTKTITPTGELLATVLIDTLPEQTRTTETVALALTDVATGTHWISVIGTITDEDGEQQTLDTAFTQITVADGTTSASLLRAPTSSNPVGWEFRPNAPHTSLFASSATYGIDLAVPPARVLGPSLSLVYNSSGTNASVSNRHPNVWGEGWNLAGIPVIVRDDVHLCYTNDNKLCGSGDGNHNYMDNDYFTLHMKGAHKLVRTLGDGSACVANANNGNGCTVEYQVEGMPGWYVEQIKGNYTADAIPNVTDEYWIVKTPNGVHYRFGYTPDAEQIIMPVKETSDPIGGHPAITVENGRVRNVAAFRWFLDEVTDPHGNEMEYQYLDGGQNPSGANGELINADRTVTFDGTNYYHEAATYPQIIHYNNRNVGWKSAVEFHYADTDYVIPDPIPAEMIFITPWKFDYVQMFDGNEAWYYDAAITPQSSNCINVEFCHVLASIERGEGAKGGSGSTWPQTTFTYEYNITGNVGPFNFSYPYLKTIDNGYDGVYEFTYTNDGFVGGTSNSQNWYVTDLKVWDGVVNTYPNTPTAHTVYTPTDPCYDQDQECHHWNGNFTDHLTGFRYVTVKTYDGDASNNILLTHTKHEFQVKANLSSNPHPLEFGRPKRERVYNGASQTSNNLIAEVNHTWTVGSGTGGWCSTQGLHADFRWICETVTRSTSYVDGNVSQDTKVERRFEPSKQHDPNNPNLRQWGLPTRITNLYLPPAGKDFEVASYHVTQYLTNSDEAEWRAVPWRQGSFASDWLPIQAQLFLYTGGGTDPDDQTIDRDAQLQWTRAIVDYPDTAPAYDTPITLTTIDTKLTYTTYGLPRKVITYDDYGSQDIRWHHQWEPITDFASDNPAEIKTTYLNQSGLKMYVNTVTDPLGGITDFTYSGGPFSWSVTNITGSNGLDSDYTYNSYGQLETVVGPEVTGSNDSTMRYAYQLTAPVQITAIANEGGGSAGQSNEIRQEAVTTADGLGRVLESRVIGVPDEVGGGTTDLVTVAEYDGLGRPVCQSLPIATNSSTIPDCDSNNHNEVEYDIAGRATRTIGADEVESTTSFAAPGASTWVGNTTLGGVLQVKTQVAEGANTHRTSYQTFDELGRLLWIGQVDEDVTCTDGRIAVTRYAYDDIGNLTAVRRGELCGSSYTLSNDEVVTTIEYDSVGRKTQMTDPDMGEYRYEYDSDSNLVRQIAEGDDTITSDDLVTCAEYDAVNRVTDQWKRDDGTTACGAPPAAGHADLLATYTYTNTPNTITYGLLDTVTYYPHTTGVTGDFSDKYGYDALGRLSKQTRIINDEVFVSEITTYDRVGRPVTTKNPAGEVQSNVYDFWGGDELWLGLDQMVSEMKVNTRGQLLNMFRTNGVDTTYTYFNDVDDAYRLDEVEVEHTGSGNQVTHFNYTYDDIGQITNIASTLGGATDVQAFTYDTLGRLKTASGTNPGYTTSYGYDMLGNLELVTNGLSTTTYTPDSDHPHAVASMSTTGIGGTTYNYTYDAFGNMTERETAGGTFDQEFDVLGRLTEVTKDDTETTRFIYDTAGIRVLTIYDNGDEVYTPTPDYEKEVLATATIERRTYTLAGSAVAIRVSGHLDEENNGLFYMHGDHLGSLSIMTHGEAACPNNVCHNIGDEVMDSKAAFKPFGDYRIQPTQDISDRGFTGHRENRDPLNSERDLGLTYMNARYYAPELRRFISADTIIPNPTDNISWNRYAYVYNNPIIYVDQSGHAPYYIFARSFAPWDWFGCFTLYCFEGDDRGYSTSLGDTSRINSVVRVDSDDTSLLGANVWSDPSTDSLGQTDTGTPSIEFEYAYSTSNSIHFRFHYSGRNPLIPSPNIDVWVTIDIIFSPNQLEVTFTVEGDNYPAFEMFIQDDFGNKVFLGVVPADSGPGGARTSLFGGGGTMHPTTTIIIHINGQGAFTGVTHNGVYYTLDEWNAQFVSQPVDKGAPYNTSYPYCSLGGGELNCGGGDGLARSLYPWMFGKDISNVQIDGR